MISLGIGELVAACCIIVTVFFGGEEGISGDRTYAPPVGGIEFISQIGLNEHLSVTRKNGLSSMVSAIKNAAKV